MKRDWKKVKQKIKMEKKTLSGMKVIVGLGNPGPKYDNTRHNVGWWVLDRLAYDWDLGSFEQDVLDCRIRGALYDTNFLLMKPTTYVNKSGMAVSHLRMSEDFILDEDLLIVVDDASLDAGRIRFRPEGRSGGHNGLKSISESLGTESYSRLKVGVGKPLKGIELSDWVLSEMPQRDEGSVVDLLPILTEAVQVWMTEGVQGAMNQFNR